MLVYVVFHSFHIENSFLIVDVIRSVAYARQLLAHKQKMDKKEGLLVFSSKKKDKDELSFLVKSVKMKSKQILDGMTRKDGKSQLEGVKKKRQH